jgi:hypothetical protein
VSVKLFRDSTQDAYENLFVIPEGRRRCGNSDDGHAGYHIRVTRTLMFQRQIRMRSCSGIWWFMPKCSSW